MTFRGNIDELSCITVWLEADSITILSAEGNLEVVCQSSTFGFLDPPLENFSVCDPGSMTTHGAIM